jgi:hypothetical protein
VPNDIYEQAFIHAMTNARHGDIAHKVLGKYRTRSGNINPRAFIREVALDFEKNPEALEAMAEFYYRAREEGEAFITPTIKSMPAPETPSQEEAAPQEQQTLRPDNSRKTEIERAMRETPSEYWRSPEMQSEYAGLVAAEMEPFETSGSENVD